MHEIHNTCVNINAVDPVETYNCIIVFGANDASPSCMILRMVQNSSFLSEAEIQFMNIEAKGRFKIN